MSGGYHKVGWYQCDHCSFSTKDIDRITNHVCKEKKRTNGEIIQSINKLLGFTEYKDKIKWSNANKEEMLRLEKAVRNLKDRSKE